jgi:hypothetical protein
MVYRPPLIGEPTVKKAPAPRRPRGETAQSDPYKPARRPARFGDDRPPRARPDRPKREFERSERPARSFDRSERPARSFDRAERPARSERPARRFGDDEARGPRSGSFTVNLDPDVARVFRGDASVNKALRLVLQLTQVVQGPPPRFAREGGGERAPRSGGYRGSAQARGFERKPRFEEDEGE